MLLRKSILKFIFILFMLFFNLWYIVRPCTVKYLEKGVMIEVSTELSGSLQSPSVTITRVGPDGAV